MVSFRWLRELFDPGSTKHLKYCTCPYCRDSRSGGGGAYGYDGNGYNNNPPQFQSAPAPRSARNQNYYNTYPPQQAQHYNPPPPARNYQPPQPGHYYPPPPQSHPQRNAHAAPQSYYPPPAATDSDSSNQPPPPYRPRGGRYSGRQQGQGQGARLARRGQAQYPPLNTGTARHNPYGGDGDGVPLALPAPPPPPPRPKPKTMDLPMRRLNPSHRDYKSLSRKFNDNWLHPGTKGQIVHIYLASGADLRGSARAQKFANTIVTKGNGGFVTRFHGTQRACQIGDGPNPDIEPCGKADCHLCSILKNGFELKYARTTGMFGAGIYSTKCSSKADLYTKNSHIRTNRRIMLICRLAGDRPQTLWAAENNRTRPDGNYNCIEAALKPNGGGVSYPETVVYSADMIIPVGFIIYKK